MQHYPFLDIIRAIAILCILLVHSNYIGGLNPPHWFEIGKIGVPLFFMLSSYTLALSQSQRSESSRLAFFARRFFRIYPLFLLMIGYVFLLQSLDGGLWLAKFDHYTWQSYLSKLTLSFGLFPNYINNFFLGEWTLFSEIMFYCLFPFVFPLIKTSRKKTLGVFVLALIIHYLWRYGRGIYKTQTLVTGPIYDYEYYSFFYHLIDFAAGFLLFHLHEKFYETPWKLWQKSLLGILVMSSLVYFSYLRQLDIQLIYWQVVVVLMGWIVWIMQIRDIFQWWINSLLQYIAKVSYSIYLTNLPILVLMYHYCKEFWPRQRLMIFILSLGIVTYFTYRYEQWGIGVGKKVIQKINNE